MTAHWNAYDPSAWGWAWEPAAIPFSYAGVAFPQGVANADVAVIFRAALDRIVPDMAEPLGLHGDCWGYEPRNVIGGASRSFHGYGIALDVNAVDDGQTTLPMSSSTTVLPLDTGARVHDLGIEWGGDWSSTSPRDPMHLELHLDPAAAHQLAVALILGPPAPIHTEDAMSVVIYTEGADGKPHNPAWFYGDGTRTHVMGSGQWSLANHLARSGACQLVPVSQADYDATTIRVQP